MRRHPGPESNRIWIQNEDTGERRGNATIEKQYSKQKKKKIGEDKTDDVDDNYGEARRGRRYLHTISNTERYIWDQKSKLQTSRVQCGLSCC